MAEGSNTPRFGLGMALPRNQQKGQQDLFSAPSGQQPAAPPRRPANPIRPIGFLGYNPHAARKPAEPPPTTPAPAKKQEASAPSKGLGGLGGLSALDSSPPEDSSAYIEQMPAPVPQAPTVPEEPTMLEIKGKVKKIIYETADGFRVYAIQTKGEQISAQITSPITADVGDKVVLKGEWGMYKNRKTFKAKLIMQDIPTDKKGVAAWLRMGTVAGVGKATGEKIAKHFGDDILDVIDKPERLVEAGIPLAKAEAIADAWTTNAMQPELIAYLGSLGIGEGTITKIIRRYGMTAKQMIESNPWQLAETIETIGFQKADEIGNNAGHAKDAPARIKAGISYALQQAVNRDGHCGLPKDRLVTEAVKLLNVGRRLVEDTLPAALDGNRNLYDETTGLASPVGIHRAESEVAHHLLRLLGGPGIPEADASAAIDAAQEKMGISLDPSQRDAAMLALTNNVCIITGGPGTGKSTTQKVIVHALKSFGKDVMLGAPTGRAAKRLAEVSGLPASTLHRLLQFSAEVGGFTYDEDNQFEEDWAIIDEFSMVDTKLCAHFIQAIATGTGLTIVGDVDQLPSVGAGQVLRDLISTGIIPVAKLTTVHRQGKDSGIVVAAHRINNGQHPLPQDEILDGFDIETSPNSEDTVKRVVELMSDLLPKMGYDPLKDVQVLAGMRRGMVGVEALNEATKAVLNPVKDDGRSIAIKGKDWTVGDRVMHNRNDYAKGVFNGEVGIVIKTGQRANEDNGKLENYIRVDYSGFEASYGERDIEDIEQCWAATVHKSQGCEFPVVVMVCPWEHANFMSRNLFYTGVTRAKTRCIVVGDEMAIGQAVTKTSSLRRFTGLPKMLARMLEEAPPPPEEDDQWPMPTPGGFISIEE